MALVVLLDLACETPAARTGELLVYQAKILLWHGVGLIISSDNLGIVNLLLLLNLFRSGLNLWSHRTSHCLLVHLRHIIQGGLAFLAGAPFCFEALLVRRSRVALAAWRLLFSLQNSPTLICDVFTVIRHCWLRQVEHAWNTDLYRRRMQLLSIEQRLLGALLALCWRPRFKVHVSRHLGLAAWLSVGIHQARRRGCTSCGSWRRARPQRQAAERQMDLSLQLPVSEQPAPVLVPFWRWKPKGILFLGHKQPSTPESTHEVQSVEILWGRWQEKLQEGPLTDHVSTIPSEGSGGCCRQLSRQHTLDDHLLQG
mmetsp:Transcript_45657/g.94418  ORF Transcript_45657/g.94418 Transcript_45657/m.94418 type:complete len:312 (-) Transcript_45657:18-953(-)